MVKLKKNGRIQAGDVYVDGSRVGDIGSVVIKDMKTQQQEEVALK